MARADPLRRRRACGTCQDVNRFPHDTKTRERSVFDVTVVNIWAIRARI